MTDHGKAREPVGGTRASENSVRLAADERENTAGDSSPQALAPDEPELGTPERLFWEIEISAGWLAHEAALICTHAAVFDLKHTTYAARRAAAHLGALLGHIADATELIMKLQREADNAGL
jgi:hypothetical protein